MTNRKENPVEWDRQRKREWYLKNRDKVIERSKKWQAEHPKKRGHKAWWSDDPATPTSSGS